jgi:hypothetical protein
MSLSWYEGQTPFAIVDKKPIFLNDTEVEDSFKSIELKPTQKFQQIPNKNTEREVLYISAMSGSGKSYYCAEYVKQYKKSFPKRDIFLFSSIDDDKCLDSIKGIKRIKIKSVDFMNMALEAKDFENSCCIFDDVDVLTDKHIKKKVFSILDSLLQTGRHFGATVIFTSHNACSGLQTKVILNEATSITIFPSTSGNKALNYLCDTYIGLDKKQISSLKKIKGRFMTFIRAYPRCIFTEQTAYLINKD